MTQTTNHDILPKFMHGRQVPTIDSTGRTVAPPYMIRVAHHESGTMVLRRATRDEIRRKDRRITMLPVHFLVANKWYPLTPKGVWAATDRESRFKVLTNPNGDTVGVGIY